SPGVALMYVTRPPPPPMMTLAVIMGGGGAHQTPSSIPACLCYNEKTERKIPGFIPAQKDFYYEQKTHEYSSLICCLCRLSMVGTLHALFTWRHRNENLCPVAPRMLRLCWCLPFAAPA